MNRTKTWVYGLTATIIPVLAASLWAAPLQHERHEPKGATSAECERMMSERKQMMSAMKQSQEEMAALVERMHQASGDAKVEAIEDVVAELVAKRQQMMEHMSEMQPRMMAHMMRHMQQGGEQSMHECPMMKEMMSGSPRSPQLDP